MHVQIGVSVRAIRRSATRRRNCAGGAARDLRRRRRLDQAGQLLAGHAWKCGAVAVRARNMSQPVFVETTISSRWPARSLRRICPNISSARRAVVVREVEVRDPELERAADDGARLLERRGAAEVVPEAEGDLRQLQPHLPTRRYCIAAPNLV